MNKKWLIFCMLAAIYMLFSASCSTTTMKIVWKNKNYQGEKLKKIFVIGVAENPTMRRVFEDEFAKQLKAHGTNAVSSYSLIPSKELIDRDTVESKMKIVGADAVIVTSLLDRKNRRIYDSNSLGYTRGWYRTYSQYHEAVQYRESRGDYYEYEVVTLETNLYEIRNGKIIWSGLSETHLDSSPSDVLNEGAVVNVIKTFIKTIVTHLSDSQFI